MGFSSFTMHQYRFEGPYANPKVAEGVYERQPVGDFLECSITAAFLITAKILSLLGFGAFTPTTFDQEADFRSHQKPTVGEPPGVACIWMKLGGREAGG